eukprot:jgi/Chrzof1/9183/Cz03g39010.t1
MLVVQCLPPVTPSFITKNPVDHLPAHKRQLLDRVWKAHVPLTERLIKEGYKFEIEGRQWPRLVEKLSQKGSTVKIVVFGGSVTVGYKDSKTNYPEQLVVWLKRAFPGVQFELLNLARRATAATFAALCLIQDMPADADLVLIEYNINGYGGQCQCFKAPQTAGYETLLRKIIKKAPNAALMAFASFIWLDKDNKLASYFETGEDQHAVVARRYGIPMMSVRDAMYDVMFNPDNPYKVNHTEILVDIVHVGDHGAKVYAAFLSWLIRHQLTRILLHQHQLHLDATKTPAPMPAPLNPDAAQEDSPTFCAEGIGLQDHVISKEGFKWVDEGSNACAGCHKYGYVATKVGSNMVLDVNSDILTANETKAGDQVALVLSYLVSYSDMGQVNVECISGCKCNATVLDAKNKMPRSELHSQRLPISPHKDCVMKLTVIEKTSTGKHKFRLSGVAVHKQDKIMSYAYAPVYD